MAARCCLGAALVSLALVLPGVAAAFPRCEDASSLRKAQMAAVAAFLKSDDCVHKYTVYQFKQIFPEGFPAGLAESFKEAVASDGSVTDPGKFVRPEERRRPRRRGKRARRRLQPSEPAPEASSPAPEGDRVPADAELVNAGAFIVRSALERGLITVECGPTAGPSAEWRHDPNCGNDKAVCGTMTFSDAKVSLANGYLSEGGEAALDTQDQLANSLVHETSHILVSLFRNAFGADSVNQRGKAKTKWMYSKHWNGCTPRGRMLGYELDWADEPPCTVCNEMAGREIGHRLLICGGRRAGKILGLTAGSDCSAAPRPLEVKVSAPVF